MRIERLSEDDSSAADCPREAIDDLPLRAAPTPDVPEENRDRETYHIYYRALVEAEYSDARRSLDTGTTGPWKTLVHLEQKLLHADADPTR
jgi:hypothetical protein